MFIYNFYVGTADKGTLKQELPERLFINCFDCIFENYTVTKVKGRYTMQDTNTVIEEDSYKVTVINAFDDVELIKKVETMKSILNQETILVTIDRQSDIKFI